MKNKTLTKDDIQKGALVLVNADNPVSLYKSKQLFVHMDVAYPNVLLEQKAASVLAHILQEIGSNGQIVPVSGFRSGSEQEQIYTDSIKDNGIGFTRKYVALPGHSEHQTGLAIDLGLNPNPEKKQGQEKQIDFLRPDFPYEGICNMFRQTSPRYGFIQRYHKDKEAITGISHEPWHFRYVGWPHSEIMQNKGLSLEEYIDFLRLFPLQGKHLKITSQKKKMEIYYIPVTAKGGTTITLPDDAIHEISGNNVDGCIVTEWRNVK